MNALIKSLNLSTAMIDALKRTILQSDGRVVTYVRGNTRNALIRRGATRLETGYIELDLALTIAAVALQELTGHGAMCIDHKIQHSTTIEASPLMGTLQVVECWRRVRSGEFKATLSSPVPGTVWCNWIFSVVRN